MFEYWVCKCCVFSLGLHSGVNQYIDSVMKCENHSWCRICIVLMSSWFGFSCVFDKKEWESNGNDWNVDGLDTIIKTLYLQLHVLVTHRMTTTSTVSWISEHVISHAPAYLFCSSKLCQTGPCRFKNFWICSIKNLLPQNTPFLCFRLLL